MIRDLQHKTADTEKRLLVETEKFRTRDNERVHKYCNKFEEVKPLQSNFNQNSRLATAASLTNTNVAGTGDRFGATAGFAAGKFTNTGASAISTAYNPPNEDASRMKADNELLH